MYYLGRNKEMEHHLATLIVSFYAFSLCKMHCRSDALVFPILYDHLLHQTSVHSSKNKKILNIIKSQHHVMFQKLFKYKLDWAKILSSILSCSELDFFFKNKKEVSISTNY